NFTIHFCQYGITVCTRVCCSMISLTQIAYGSRVARHGSSRRTTAKCATTALAIARSRLTPSIVYVDHHGDGRSEDQPEVGRRLLVGRHRPGLRLARRVREDRVRRVERHLPVMREPPADTDAPAEADRRRARVAVGHAGVGVRLDRVDRSEAEELE